MFRTSVQMRQAVVFVSLLLMWGGMTFVLSQRTKKKPILKPDIKNYKLSSAQSQITAVLIQEGLLRKLHPTHRIAAKNFSGRIQLPSDETQVVIEVEAEAKSLANIDPDLRDFERTEFHKVLHSNVLESERFPAIKFRSISLSNLQKSGDQRNFTLHGEMTLRGVTKRVAFPVKMEFTANRLQASGEATFRQSEFGITPYSGGLGAIKIGDQIKINFVIVATS